MSREDNEDVIVTHDGIVRSSDRAILFRFADSEEWIPKSQIRAHTEKTITIPVWLAVERGLE